jgi:exodeoxyribonuclease VII, small subunit
MKQKSYEEAVKRLEEIVNLLERNEVPLEESIHLFQEGIELSQYCNDKLDNIQKKVAKIYENNELKEFTGEE